MSFENLKRKVSARNKSEPTVIHVSVTICLYFPLETDHSVVGSNFISLSVYNNNTITQVIVIASDRDTCDGITSDLC